MNSRLDSILDVTATYWGVDKGDYKKSSKRSVSIKAQSKEQYPHNLLNITSKD